MSIRWRLALTSAGLTFAILLVFAAVVGELTTQRIRHDFNNQLAAAADDLQTKLTITIAGGRVTHVEPKLDDYAGPEHAAIRIVTEDGFLVAGTDRAPDFAQPVPGTATIGAYRVATRFVRLNPSGHVFVQYARRLSDIDATVAKVRLFLTFGVLAGTGLALAGGLMVSRRAIRPIARLTATARDIASTRDLKQRVPVPESDDEVAELAVTLNEMLQALEASRRETEATLTRQREFVADASHELRTPLTSVHANLELLADVLKGERGEAARAALRSAQRMRRLLGDLLILARADAKRSGSRTVTDLRDVVAEAAAELSPVSGGHVLVVDAEPAPVEGSRDDLHRLVLNLLENAIRHTPDGTHIRALVQTALDDTRLIVEDDGPGVPPGMRDRLFERFSRGDGDRGGSFGLGLSIVKAVAESHGGSVRLESPDGVGARFVVTLPLARTPVAA
jgi:signal transduction histidine kinase